MKIVKNTDNAVLKDKSEVSDKEAEEAFRTILRWIGENPNREGLLETPKRVTNLRLLTNKPKKLLGQ